MSDKPKRELLPGEAEVDAWIDTLEQRADAMSDDTSDDARKSEKTHILWATNMDDDGYADLLFLVGDKSPYGVGINCGGDVIVKPLREWHRLATLEEG